MKYKDCKICEEHKDDSKEWYEECKDCKKLSDYCKKCYKTYKDCECFFEYVNLGNGCFVFECLECENR